MRVTQCVIASVLLFCAVSAHAHAHLSASIPQDGSTGKAPEQIVLTFSETTRLTAMSLQREGDASRKLPLPATPAAQFTVPLTKLLPGRYTLSWRALSGDGHVTSGSLHFTVVEPSGGSGAGAAGDHGS
jgi:methionine-rich copper-binding protein CopC